VSGIETLQPSRDAATGRRGGASVLRSVVGACHSGAGHGDALLPPPGPPPPPPALPLPLMLLLLLPPRELCY